ncbi:MAG TPA: ABC transporter permease [Spirochaetia bacterium]|nr:ABC transporter permease [Spirochaetia bacterium]
MIGSSWVAFVSGRWYSARRESGGSASSILASAGIAIGVAALIVVLAVMNGFQMGFIDSILEIASFHVRIEGQGSSLDAALLDRLAAEPGVRSVLPYAETRCLLASRDGRALPLALRLLPEDAERRDPALAPALALEPPLFAAAEGRAPSLVLGVEAARYLGLAAGAEAELLVVGASAEEGLETRSLEVRIGRTFRSGYYDFDAGMAFAPLALAPEILGPVAAPPIAYGVKLENRYADGEFASRLAADYGLGPGQAQSWRDYNRAFFGALRTEKTVMMLLIGLIFLVVGVNIFHSMRRAVAEKMEDIAVLRALGASPEALRRAFILDGLAIGAGGAFVGLLLGLLVAVNVNEVFAIAEAIVNGLASLAARLGGPGAASSFRVFSPQYFYLMEVPVRVLFPETLFVVAVATASAAAAAAAASTRVSRLLPAEVLRNE